MDLNAPPVNSRSTPAPISPVGPTALVSHAPPSRLSGQTPSVHTQIDTLVLRGFPAMDTRRVHEAFSSEWQRMVETSFADGTPWKPASAESMEGLRIQFSPAMNASALGREIARKVFNRLRINSEER